MQAGVFSIRGRDADAVPERDGRAITVADLKHSVANYLGIERTERAFNAYFEKSGEVADTRELAR